jgi:hypothetical protein
MAPTPLKEPRLGVSLVGQSAVAGTAWALGIDN